MRPRQQSQRINKRAGGDGGELPPNDGNMTDEQSRRKSDPTVTRNADRLTGHRAGKNGLRLCVVRGFSAADSGTRRSLFCITQRSNHVVQFFKRDEPAAVL